MGLDRPETEQSRAKISLGLLFLVLLFLSCSKPPPNFSNPPPEPSPALPGAHLTLESFLDESASPLPEPSLGSVGVTLSIYTTAHRPQKRAIEFLLIVGLQGTHDVTSKRDPVNVGLIIDRSGSTADADKLAIVKQASEALVSRLGPEDMLSLITFDARAKVVLTAAPTVPAAELLAALDGITPGTQTNFSDGLSVAGSTVLTPSFLKRPEETRLLVISDGSPTTGERSLPALVRLVTRMRRAGITTSMMGIGHGYNSTLFAALSQAGGGRYYFPETPVDVTRGFADEVDMLAPPVAGRVRVTVELNEGVAVKSAIGEGVQSGGREVSWRADKLGSGQTRLWLLRLTAPDSLAGSQVANVEVTWRDKIVRRRRTERHEVVLKNIAPFDSSAAQKIDNLAAVTDMLIATAQTYITVADLVDKSRYKNAHDQISAMRDSLLAVGTRLSSEKLLLEANLMDEYEKVMRLRAFSTIAVTTQEIRALSLRQRREQTRRLKGWLRGMKDIFLKRFALTAIHKKHALRRDVHRRLSEIGTISDDLLSRFENPGPKSLAIPQFVWADGSRDSLSSFVTNRVIRSLERRRQYRVVKAGAVLDATMADSLLHTKTRTGWGGANLIILGRMIRQKDAVTITARLITLSDFETQTGAYLTVPITPGLEFLWQ